MKRNLSKKLLTIMITALLLLQIPIQDKVVHATSNKLSFKFDTFLRFYGYYPSGKEVYGGNGLPRQYAEEFSFDENVSYCIEHGVFTADGHAYNDPTIHTDYSKLSQSTLRKLSLISYYGYDLNPSKENRQFTQLMIWEELGSKFTNVILQNSGNSIYSNFTSFKSNVNSKINNHSKVPSFNANKITLRIGESVTLTDTNGVFNEFNTVSDSGLTVTKSGNKVTITAKANSKDGRITFNKVPNKFVGSTLIYQDKGFQDIATFKVLDPVPSYLDVTIQKVGNLKIAKKNELGNFVPNTSFELSNNKSNILGTYTTGSNGKVTIKDLDEGKYYVREKSVPSPLIIDTTWKEVTIKSNETTSFTATNKDALGKIEITKYGYSTFDASIPSRAWYDYIVVGAKFDVKDSSGKVVDTLTTGSNGKATTKELPLGKYTIVETFVPSPLVLDTTPIEANIAYKDQTTSVVLRQVSQRNKEAVGKIEVVKKSVHGDLIKDTVFEIKDKDNNVVDTLTTDSKGYAKTKELLLGKYTVTEVSVPNNLVLEKTPIIFELKYKNQVTPVVVESTTKVNDYQRSDLVLTKVENNWDTLFSENNGIKLKGALLDLYARQDILEGSKKIYIKDELVGTKVSDKHGNVTFHNLPIGEYYIKEVEAPEGYILHDDLWYVSIKYDNKNSEVEVTTSESTLTNQIAYGKSKLHKTSNNGKEFLEGAKFGLYKEDGTLIKEFITDKKGELVSTNLRYGKYYWQEIEAPEGYFTDNTKHEFEITVEGHKEVIHFPVDNKYIEIRCNPAN